MLITGVGEHELFSALHRADASGNLTFNRIDANGHTRAGRRKWQVTLRVNDSRGRFARRGMSGRRMIAACYHAHLAFMRELFALEPSANIFSSMATYTSASDLEARKFDAANRNVGSIMYPLYHENACECNGGKS